MSPEHFISTHTPAMQHFGTGEDITTPFNL